MNIYPNTYTVLYPSDFYEHLLLISGQQFTLKNNFIIYNCQDSDLMFKIKRMILSTGFEISFAEYNITNDIGIDYNIEYEGVEILATYNNTDSQPISIGYQLRFKNSKHKITDTMPLTKGKYTCINIYIDKSYLKEQIDLRHFFLAPNKEWIELKGSIRTAFISIFSQIRSCQFKDEALRFFYQSKSLEALSYILRDVSIAAPILSLPEFNLMKSDTDALYKAKTIIEQHYNSKLTIPQIAKQVHMSSNKLMSCYRRLFGMTINSHIINCRMKQALHLIQKQGSTVAETSGAVGYAHQGHFIKIFKKYYGVTPNKMKKH